MIRLATLVAVCSSLLAADKWDGDLTVTSPAEGLKAGASVRLAVSAVGGDGKAKPGVVADRAASFHLLPYRWNLSEGPVRPLTAVRAAADAFTVTLPKDLPTGWYILVTTVADDDGRLLTVDEAANGERTRRFLDRAPVVVRGTDAGGPFLRVHAERGRGVFSPGERLRLFLSARGKAGVKGAGTIGLVVRGQSIPLAAGALAAGPGQEQVLAFDIEPAVSAAIPPGDHELVASLDGKAMDRVRVRFVAPQRPSGGGRWAHTMPSGNTPGFDGAPVLPERLADGEFGGHAERTVAGIHKANLWVNFFANGWPIIGNGQDLPEAGAADLPPAAAEYRPAHTHAYYQKMMAEGVALGLFMGYGEDYKAEVYMPLPTIDRGQQAVLARKYLAGALAASTLPNFVAAYTDAYGHMDWSGGGELSAEELAGVRDATWTEAAKAAGIPVPAKPVRLSFDWDDWSPAARDALKKKDGKAREAFEKVWKDRQTAVGGGKDWLEKAAPTDAERIALWNACFAAAGITPPPEPPRAATLPELDEEIAAKVGRDAAYRFASFVLRGIERCYGAITRGVEAELPAVFTIHNMGTMNHSVAPHAWTGFRTPNIDPAYAVDGASAVSVSEWNLDAVPKPYFLPTFYQQNLVDRGIPVYQCGLWKQMGSPARFLRDGMFWMGRGIQTYFDQTGNMTWSHIGADQTTYASNERLAAVSEVLSAYSDLVPRLEPVREVGYYVPPVGGPWGHATTRGSYVGMVASLMAGWQTHMVSHADLATPQGLGRYPIIYAASVGPDSLFPFEQEAFRRYTAAGGTVVVSQAPNYYHKPEAYQRSGISSRQVQSRDDQGNLRTNKDGTPRMTTEWTESPEQWAKVTRESVWGFLKDRVVPAAIDVNLHFTHREADGTPATWSGSHWTGHHEWAKFRGSALDQHPALAKAFATVREPIVRKDRPEVFVDVTKPRGGGAGWWVFASNWTLPDEPDLYTQRVTQGFFNSSVKPVKARLALRLDGAGAVYDVLAARRVETVVEGGRLAFTADLSDAEGRLYAVLPEAIGGAVLTAPAQLRAGEPLRARFALRGASGKDLGILGAVRVQILDGAGAVLQTVDRALPPDGRLPELPVPAGAATLRVIDTVAGFTAEARIQVAAPAAAPAAPAAPVTVHRADRVAAVLASPGLVVAWDAGDLEFKDGTKRVVRANPQAVRDRAWAEKLVAALAGAGIKARAAGSDELVSGPLYAHPWTGGMAGYRVRHTVPDIRIEPPVVLVGDPAASPVLSELERSWVAGRSLGRDQVGPGRAVVTFQPKAFSPTQDAVVVAAADDAGLTAAAAQLAALVKTRPPADPTFAARERLRFAWLPSEVLLAKQGRGLAPATAAVPAAGVATEAKPGWSGVGGALGQAVVAIDAGPAGVVVGTKSWDTPTVLIAADGTVRGAWGGGAEVTPRDVGISVDGGTAWAGYSLMGRLAAYRPGKGALFSHPTPVIHKDNPFEWDSFKDTDRHLGMSPDKSVAIGQVAGSLVAFDPATGKERWRIAGHASPDAPRGLPMPEVGFSADGRFALVTANAVEGRRSVRYTVNRRIWDAAAKRYDRKTEPVEITVQATVIRRELRLVESATGTTVWARPVAFTLVDAASGDLVWTPGKPPQQVVTDPKTDNRPRTWTGGEDDVPVDTATGKPVVVPPLLDLAMWHLYSAVGPGGAWSVAGTRDAMFALLDDKGTLLRRFEPRDLPPELDPGQQIPPTLLPSRDPEKILVFAPQAKAAFLFRIKVGSPEARRRARELDDGNRALMARIREVIGERNQYRRFGDKAWMDGFAGELAAVPADLRGELLAQMGRVDSEGRAGRKRGPDWFTTIIERIDRRLYDEDAQAMSVAVGLEQVRRIDLPAMISDIRADARLDTIYAGLWDGTVRAIATADGATRWTAAVEGGSRLATVTDAGGTVTALYAGGSRGRVARIDPATGKILWTVATGAVTAR
jgi:outer membrane protein assembly factor BamB